MRFKPFEWNKDQLHEALIKVITLDIAPSIKKELLTILIWKIGEYEIENTDSGSWYSKKKGGKKYVMRYRSAAAKDLEGDNGLNHEHVYTKAWLIKELLNAKNDTRIISEIEGKIIPCIVTKKEHKILSDNDRNAKKEERILHGWDRYKNAGIRVWDTREKRWLREAAP